MLIQKDVKLQIMFLNFLRSLRALLIQKDVKQINDYNEKCKRLRALLIQKDVKHFVSGMIKAFV